MYGSPDNQSKENTLSDLSSDLQNWMSNLPEKLKLQPIVHLAIPGSHDSFTWKINSRSEISPDAEEIVKALAQLGPILKYILVEWCVTQPWSAKTQLENGIRYFDIRTSTMDKSNDLYIVHTLYSVKLFEMYDEINTFLEAHPKEVVILDHQHFYDCDEENHDKLIKKMEQTFGDKILPCNNISDMESITLRSMNNMKQQVIIVYRQEKIAAANLKLWPTKYCPTPWPNTTDQDVLFKFLDDNLKIRDPKYAYVSQCVLTPDAQLILSNLGSSLKEKCAEQLQVRRNEWISEQSPGPAGVNIFIADFVDMLDNKFTHTVINLNQKLVSRLFTTS